MSTIKINTILKNFYVFYLSNYLIQNPFYLINKI